jgi:2-oxo-4-hydroxy-4-carboxy-5-ureidoimidazoline decarboxylase
MLDAFNAADPADLRAPLRACCAADAWIDAVLDGRPYPDEAALGARSDAATAALDDFALGQALSGHPRIGERADSAWSNQEQAGMVDASADLHARLAAANAAYEQRFGHVYLVCATGKSALELLAICEARLANTAELERAVVLQELAKINRIRLTKLLHPELAS